MKQAKVVKLFPQSFLCYGGGTLVWIRSPILFEECLWQRPSPSRCPIMENFGNKTPLEGSLENTLERGARQLFRGQWHAWAWGFLFSHSLNIVFVSPGFIDCLLDLYSWGEAPLIMYKFPRVLLDVDPLIGFKLTFESLLLGLVECPDKLITCIKMCLLERSSSHSSLVLLLYLAVT